MCIRFYGGWKMTAWTTCSWIELHNYILPLPAETWPFFFYSSMRGRVNLPICNDLLIIVNNVTDGSFHKRNYLKSFNVCMMPI